MYSYSFSENKHGGILSRKKAQHKRNLAESNMQGTVFIVYMQMVNRLGRDRTPRWEQRQVLMTEIY